jgi:hypothetical protein
MKEKISFFMGFFYGDSHNFLYEVSVHIPKKICLLDIHGHPPFTPDCAVTASKDNVNPVDVTIELIVAIKNL